MADRDRWAPWTLSLTLHAAAVVGSLFVVWTILPAEIEPERPVIIDLTSPAPAPPPRASEPEPVASALAPPLPVPAAPAPVFESLRPVADPLPTPAASPAVPPVPEYETTFITAGASNAREVVYVVDASGSAITAFPYIAARVRDSLARLHPTQRFQIILIRSGPDRPYEFLRLGPAATDPVPIDAIPEHLMAASAWMETIVPGGPSDIPAALTAALTVRADAVFVLARVSEADRAPEEADDLLERLDALNPQRHGTRRTTVRAMQMLAPDPTGLLERIALAHGGPGAYTLVTLDDLRPRTTP